MTRRKHGLGRLPAPDPRDGRFPVRALLEQAPYPLPSYRYWHDQGWWGDQGSTSQCVAYAWTHWYEDGPTTHTTALPDPKTIYAEAQELDEWDGTSYDGTSVRAGAKALQARGAISAYWWATTTAEVVAALCTLGPVVVGTNWYASMMRPDPQGRLTVDPGSGLLGGHAYVLNGVNRKTGIIRAKNSWSKSWGKQGRFTLTTADLDHLLAHGAEACLATEVASP